jgi:hypothetical protein
MMKRALSLVDGRTWDAAEYGDKDETWQARRRRQLACLGCGGQATFRAGSRRVAFFAARHRQDCLLAAKTWSVFRYLQ